MIDNMFNDFQARNFTQFGKSNVISSKAMVVSSHPIASSVGIEIFGAQIHSNLL